MLHGVSTGQLPTCPINTVCFGLTLSAPDSSPSAISTQSACVSRFQHWTAPHLPHQHGLFLVYGFSTGQLPILDINPVCLCLTVSALDGSLSTQSAYALTVSALDSSP
ncbi:unnamed protein product [Gadus morhua 'NCC']